MAEVAALNPKLSHPARAAAVPAREAVTVLHFGPGLDVRGGVSSVERLIVGQSLAGLNARHIATMEEGSMLRKAVVFFQAMMELRRRLDTSEPIIVHIHFASRGSTLRKLILAQMTSRAGIPLVLHAHGGGFDTFYRRLPAGLRRKVNGILQRANLFLTLSSQWRDFYVQECELAPTQVAVLPNPVRLPAEVPDRRGRKRVQFLFLGRLVERKGSHDLVRAFGMLDPGLRARAQLVLVGDGDLAGVARLAQPLREAVLVLPWVDAARRDRLFGESDVFVLASHAEGMPMALLEAMANGLPAITTAVGGIPDVMSDGVEGLFVEPGNVEKLRSALATMIRDEPRRLACGARARERARQFDAADYATRLRSLYQRIAPVTKLRAFS